MSEAASAPATTPSKPKAKKPRVTGKKPASNKPKYLEMAIAAIAALKERNGSSRQAINKYILSHYNVSDSKAVNTHLKLALKRGVATGRLKHVKGQGASGYVTANFLFRNHQILSKC